MLQTSHCPNCCNRFNLRAALRLLRAGHDYCENCGIHLRISHRDFRWLALAVWIGGALSGVLLLALSHWLPVWAIVAVLPFIAAGLITALARWAMRARINPDAAVQPVLARLFKDQNASGEARYTDTLP